jgi:predicted transcriptional regulator
MQDLSPKTPYDVLENQPVRVYSGPGSYDAALRDEFTNDAREAANAADAKGGEK